MVTGWLRQRRRAQPMATGAAALDSLEQSAAALAAVLPERLRPIRLRSVRVSAARLSARCRSKALPDSAAALVLFRQDSLSWAIRSVAQAVRAFAESAEAVLAC